MLEQAGLSGRSGRPTRRIVEWPRPYTRRAQESGGLKGGTMSETFSEQRTLPVLPLRNIVVFPHMVVPLFVGRDKTVRALEEAMRGDKQILLVTQKNENEDDPAVEAIYEIGVIAKVLQLLKLPDGTVKVLVEGAERARILRYTE